MYKDKVVVITGGAHGIGSCIASEFSKAGALVEVIDILELLLPMLLINTAVLMY